MPLLLTPRSLTGAAARLPAPIRRDAGTITIGRDPGNDLVLDHPSASSRHCVVTGSDAGWQLQDSSTNGTKVNGQRIGGAHMLRHGDVIVVADLEIVVAMASAHQRPAALAPDPWHRSPPTPSQQNATGHAATQRPGSDDVAARAAIDGLARLEAARRKALAELGVPITTGRDDPFATGTSDGVWTRLAAMPPQAGAAAVTQVCDALAAHERATLAAMQATFRATLDHFAPAAIKARARSDAEAWKAYERAFGAADGFVETFAQEMAKAYRAAVSR